MGVYLYRDGVQVALVRSMALASVPQWCYFAKFDSGLVPGRPYRYAVGVSLVSGAGPVSLQSMPGAPMTLQVTGPSGGPRAPRVLLGAGVPATPPLEPVTVDGGTL